MEKDNLFEVFAFLSKAVIIIPIAVVIISLLLHFNQQPSKKSTLIIAPTLLPAVKPTTPKIKIDLKGPLICQGNLQNSSATAYIKDKKIKAVVKEKNTTSNFLVNGDCFYNWKAGEFVGSRICGLSPILSLFETMSGFGGMGLDLILNQLTQLGVGNKIATDQAKIAELINACKKQTISDLGIFEIPKNVLFKNAK